MKEMVFCPDNGKRIKFDDFVEEVEEYGIYWAGVCSQCIDKYKEEFGDRVSSKGACGYCGIQGCLNEADQYVDFKPDEVCLKRSGLHELIHDMTSEENAWVNVKELTERFVEIDELYLHSHWNLEQILSNINIFIPEKIPESGGSNGNDNTFVLPEKILAKLLLAYEDNKYELYRLDHHIDEYGILDNGISDIHDTYEMGYNSALQYVFSVLGVRSYDRIPETSTAHNNSDYDDYFEERCPYCDHYNEVKWKEGDSRRIICEKCGEEVLLCQLCDPDDCNCGKCPY